MEEVSSMVLVCILGDPPAGEEARAWCLFCEERHRIPSDSEVGL